MRLIDADALKQFIGNDTILKNNICRIIDVQPTAYDVEAVVDKIMQLYDATENCGDECNAWNCRECYENHLRDILRNSGKE